MRRKGCLLEAGSRTGKDNYECLIEIIAIDIYGDNSNIIEDGVPEEV